jgi:hypothetical protein
MGRSEGAQRLWEGGLFKQFFFCVGWVFVEGE